MKQPFDKKSLVYFLVACNKAGYVNGNEKSWIKEKDSSTTISFTKGKWFAHDNFFGGEPYGGRLVVFYDKKPVWMMVYYGAVEEGVEVNDIYTVLRRALARMPIDAPFRGPKRYKEGSWIYTNTWQGDAVCFSGKEQIRHGGNIVYKARYVGGFVDRRQGV